jgi:SAM-dependent methyltransferase
MSRTLPNSASIAHQKGGAKLHAPSAERNADALCQMLRRHAPSRGKALEIASGTGQHVIAFAQVFPNLDWQPTEIDASRRASIDAYVLEAKLPNVASAIDLRATEQGWRETVPAQDLITLTNLLHLISTAQVRTLIGEAARALTPDGVLILYGPFKRDGQLTSAGDAQFDAELRAADPDIGYKDTVDITATLEDAGLTDIQTDTRPANNLAFIARKPKP